MGELFAHFQGWDVQAIRKESREQALIEARKVVQEEMQREIESTRKKVTRQVTQQVTQRVTEQVTQQVTEQVTEQVTQQVTEQVTESDIQKLLTVLHKLGCPRETVIEQLMEQYQMAYETAATKTDDFWERS